MDSFFTSDKENHNKFYASFSIHVYEKRYVNKFKNLIKKRLRKIDGVHIQNVTSILYQNKNKETKTTRLFDPDELLWWKKYWKNMPAFTQKTRNPLLSIQVFVDHEKALSKLSSIFDCNFSSATKFIHYPGDHKRTLTDTYWTADKILLPDYPIYIISKGRWESRLTVKALEEMDCPYRIVIEPQEYDKYAAVIDPEKILVLPFSNLGQGSIPARNWVWEHSISEGHKWHWILDDNIREFYRLHRNERLRIKCPNIFYVIEQFVNRYENIGLSGMHYKMFMPNNEERPPFFLNTRIYSCILIRNDLDFRWRGRFNEDTDLSLRVLKNGWCTILFNALLCDKIATLTMKGGNTEEVYADTDNRREFAESLKNQHPKLVKIIKRFNRWHHYVRYDKFTQQPKLKKGIDPPDKINEFGIKPNQKVKKLYKKQN